MKYLKINDYFYISTDNVDAIEKADELNTILYMKRDTYLGLKKVTINMPFDIVLKMIDSEDVNSSLMNTFLKKSSVPAW